MIPCHPLRANRNCITICQNISTRRQNRTSIVWNIMVWTDARIKKLHAFERYYARGVATADLHKLGGDVFQEKA